MIRKTEAYMRNNMGVREIGWECVNWINLPQDRDHWSAFVNTIMNLQVS
jgi:hypothetical protein